MLHTHEVTGSSPVVSTKKFPIPQGLGNFSSLFDKITVWVSVWISSDPNRDPDGEMGGKRQEERRPFEMGMEGSDGCDRIGFLRDRLQKGEMETARFIAYAIYL